MKFLCCFPPRSLSLFIKIVKWEKISENGNEEGGSEHVLGKAIWVSIPSSRRARADTKPLRSKGWRRFSFGRICLLVAVSLRMLNSNWQIQGEK